MKTIEYLQKISRMIFLVLVLWIFGSNVVICQTWIHLAKMNSTASEILQYDYPLVGISRVGIGFANPTVPSAKFHIIDNPAYGFSAFQTDMTNKGSVKHWFNDGSYLYGIYQTSLTSGILNYFQDPVKIGSLVLEGSNPPGLNIFTLNRNNYIDFNFGPSTPSTASLRVDSTGIIVHLKTKTDSFQMVTNPGLGYILLSDAEGNGNWTDPSTFGGGNRWLINRDSDMYSHPHLQHVGIGFQKNTDKIYQRLHVIDGNILISRSPTIQDFAPASKNGSILFGEVIDSTCPNGEWGIEYSSDTIDSISSGLNFWRVATKLQAGFNYALYLKNDGTVGIGTPTTYGYKLAVNGSILCQELKVRKRANWPDYVLRSDYKLLPLKEVENYINRNQHLPDIPSAKEIDENGISVGEMNVALLKKVEELTKYLIEQQKQIDDLKLKLENR
jgi:hypothetical protein